MSNRPVHDGLSRRSFLTAAAGAVSAAGLSSMMPGSLWAQTAPTAAPAGPHALPPLPYAEDALAPVISAQTVGFHYGKHHKGYVTRMNELLVGSPLAALSLEELVKKTAGDPGQVALFNAAAQTWNHTFYWQGLKPGGGGAPTGKLLEAVNSTFGGVEKFNEAFVKAGVAVFGSGWAWLVASGGKLEIVQTKDADTPVAHGKAPLLTLDVWEHAYYLDYQNRRKDYAEALVSKLLSWEAASAAFNKLP